MQFVVFSFTAVKVDLLICSIPPQETPPVLHRWLWDRQMNCGVEQVASYISKVINQQETNLRDHHGSSWSLRLLPLKQLLQ